MNYLDLKPNESFSVSIKCVKEYPKNVRNDLYTTETSVFDNEIITLTDCRLIAKRYKKHPNLVYLYIYTTAEIKSV